MTALVSAELLKIRTTRLWWGLLLGALALTSLIAVVGALTAGQSVQGRPLTPDLRAAGTLRSVYGAGLSGGYLFSLLLGIIGMTGEYRHQTLTATLLVTPRRSVLVGAKLAAYALVGLGYGVVLSAWAAGVGALTITLRGFPLGLGADGVARTLVLAALGVAVWAVFGLGLGTLLTNQVAAVLAALGFLIVGEPLLGLLLNYLDVGAAARYLPGLASQALSAPAVTGDNGVLPWWGGAGMLLGYGGAFAAVGMALTSRRDVT